MAWYDLALPDDRWSLFSYAQDLFDNRIDFVAEEAEKLWTDMQAKLSEVLEAAITISEIDLTTVDFDEVPDPELDANRPIPPTSPVYEMDFPTPPATITAPEIEIQDFPVSDTDITLPAVGVAIGDTDYSSDLLTALREKLESDIETGDTGLDPAIEDQIWLRNYERDLQTLQDEKDRIRAEWAKLDWDLPDGLLATMLTEAETKFSDKRLDTSREAAIKQAEITFQGMQHRLNTGVDLEKSLMNLFTEIQNRIQKASAAEMEGEISLYSAQINRLNSLVTIYKALADVSIEEAKAIVDVYTSQVEAYSKSVQAESDRVNAIIRGYIGEVDGYKAQVDAYATMNELQIKIFDGRIRSAVAKAEIAIKNAEISAENARLKESLELKALEVILSAMTQLEAGLIGSINLSARIDASNSASYNYSAPATIEEVLEI